MQAIPKTTVVSPIDLAVGDRVWAHGAILEVMHINTYECAAIPDGKYVAACTSRLIGEDTGAIPPAWFDTPASMKRAGYGEWVENLPAGKYWNVQGNALARVHKIVTE